MNCGANFKELKHEAESRKLLEKGVWKDTEKEPAATKGMHRVFKAAQEAYVRSQGKCQVFVAVYREGLKRNTLTYQGKSACVCLCM